MPTVSDILEIIFEYAPLGLALEYDNITKKIRKKINVQT